MMSFSIAAMFRYQQAMNEKLFKLLANHEDKVPDEAMQLLCHTIQAHEIWNSRIEQTSHDPLNLTFGILEASERHEKQMQRSFELIARCDAEASIAYRNLKGESFQSSVQDIFFHVSNHYTHHRAQIMRLLRENGIAPFSSDYIFYIREL